MKPELTMKDFIDADIIANEQEKILFLISRFYKISKERITRMSMGQFNALSKEFNIYIEEQFNEKEQMQFDEEGNVILEEDEEEELNRVDLLDLE